MALTKSFCDYNKTFCDYLLTK